MAMPQAKKVSRARRKVLRTYTLQLPANPGKVEDTRYALWWYRKFVLAYTARCYNHCSLDWESTAGKGSLAHQAQERALHIMRAGYAAYAATGSPFLCPSDFPLLCNGIVGKNKGTSFTYWIKTPLGPWLPAQTHRALKNALRRGGRLRRGCEVRQGKRGGLVAIVFIEFPAQKRIDRGDYLACDVGVNIGVARSDGRMSRSLRPILNQTKARRAEEQRQGHRKTSARSAVKQLLDQEARKAVMLAAQCGKSLVIESSQALANLKPSGSIGGWPRRHFAERVRQIAEVEGVFVREVWPARSSTTCPQCWYSDKVNRRGIHFCCGRCGHMAHADHVAGINLARRARGVWHPEISDKKAALQTRSEEYGKTVNNGGAVSSIP